MNPADETDAAVLHVFKTFIDLIKCLHELETRSLPPRIADNCQPGKLKISRQLINRSNVGLQLEESPIFNFKEKKPCLEHMMSMALDFKEVIEAETDFNFKVEQRFSTSGEVIFFPQKLNWTCGYHNIQCMMSSLLLCKETRISRLMKKLLVANLGELFNQVESIEREAPSVQLKNELSDEQLLIELSVLLKANHDVRGGGDSMNVDNDHSFILDDSMRLVYEKVLDTRSIQKMIERAWAMDFDVSGGKAYFGNALCGKKDWIGTVEAVAFFRSFGLRAVFIDFDFTRRAELIRARIAAKKGKVASAVHKSKQSVSKYSKTLNIRTPLLPKAVRDVFNTGFRLSMQSATGKKKVLVDPGATVNMPSSNASAMKSPSNDNEVEEQNGGGMEVLQISKTKSAEVQRGRSIAKVNASIADTASKTKHSPGSLSGSPSSLQSAIRRLSPSPAALTPQERVAQYMAKMGSKDERRQLNWPLIEFCWNYFSTEQSVVKTRSTGEDQVIFTRATLDFILPLYFQHQGHSRTLIGMERITEPATKASRTFFLFLDPNKPEQSVLNDYENAVRVGSEDMSKEQYQVVFILDVNGDRGIMTPSELKELRVLSPWVKFA